MFFSKIFLDARLVSAYNRLMFDADENEATKVEKPLPPLRPERDADEALNLRAFVSFRADVDNLKAPGRSGRSGN